VRRECDYCGLAACDLPDGVDPELVFSEIEGGVICIGCAGGGSVTWRAMTDPAPLTRAQKVDAHLDDLYNQVPNINCKGLCTDSCGPVDGGAREVVRMRRAGVALPPAHEGLRLVLADPGYRCPALVDGACSTYGVRPMICRVWGASEDLPCPHGCRPEPGTPLLSSAETQHLVDAARKAGTSQEPVSVAEMERRLADPVYGSAYRAHVAGGRP
jgi:hypothetical protein